MTFIDHWDAGKPQLQPIMCMHWDGHQPFGIIPTATMITDSYEFVTCVVILHADSVVSRSECPAPTDLQEPAAQDQPIRRGDEAPDPPEGGAHLQGPPHWRQAAGSEVGSRSL